MQISKHALIAVLVTAGILPWMLSSCTIAHSRKEDSVARVMRDVHKQEEGRNEDYLLKRIRGYAPIGLEIGVTRGSPHRSDDYGVRAETEPREDPRTVMPFLYQMAPGDVITVAFFRKPDTESRAGQEEYRLDCRDVITVNADIEGGVTYNVQVRMDGRISFFQIEDMYVKGKTLAEVRRMLTEAFREVVPEAHITVFLQKGTAMLDEFLNALRTWSEGTTRTLRVRRDGFANFPLLGDMKVAGKTVPQLSRELEEKYNAIFYEPLSVSVNISNSYLSHVIVLGEVKEPGVYPIHDRINPMHALAMAGGVLETGNREKIQIVRRTAEGTFNHYPLNLKMAWRRHGVPEVLMEPQDIIFVPKTGIADVNKFVEQYIRRLLPIPVSGSATYDLNP